MKTPEKMSAKIVLISHESMLYGAPRSLSLIEQHLRSDYSTRIVTFGRGDLVNDIQQSGGTVNIVSNCALYPDENAGTKITARVWRNILRIQRRICALWSFFSLLIFVRSSDLVYVNTVLRLSPILAARLLGKTVILHVREAENYLQPTSRWQKQRLNMILNGAQHIICVSSAVKQILLANPDLKVKADNVSVVYNGISVSQFKNQSHSSPHLADELEIDKNAVLVGFVGNTTHRKGLDIFIEAAAGILKKSNNVHFVICGGTPDDLRPYKQSVETLQIGSHVHFLGFRHDISSVLRDVDIFAMLSRCEPFARVNLEASAMHCAIVATAVDGNVEIFKNGQNAILIPSNNTQSVIDALLGLLSDQKHCQVLAQNAFETVEQSFTLEKTHAEIQSIIEYTLMQTRAIS
ncbi:MAG: glycosyltransferase family 4 protein [Alphaproteobacteria bacterium]